VDTLSSFKEFRTENKSVLKAYVPNLFIQTCLTFVAWHFLDVVNHLRLLGLPCHFWFEWVWLFDLGLLIASLKKTALPSSVIVLVCYLLSVFSVWLFQFALEGFWLLFLVLFLSPLPMGYFVKRALATVTWL